MVAYRYLLSLGVIVLAIDYCLGGATEEQMMAAGKMMRDICQPKFKISDELANNLGKGVFPEDKDLKCYVNCIMEMMQMMKKGKFLYESALKQVELLMPDDLKALYIPGLAKCKNSVDGIKNNCDAAYTLLKCTHENIERFVFP